MCVEKGPVPGESESEMFLFDPYKKYIQSNNETILDQRTPIKGNAHKLGLNMCYSKSYYHSPCSQIIKLHKNAKDLKFDIICLLPPLNALCILWTRIQNNARYHGHYTQTSAS